MRSIRRILVAIKDYETRTVPALTKAAQIARALGARLEIFHGISDPLYVDGSSTTHVDLPELQSNLRTRVLAKLEKLADKFRDQGVAVSVAAEWDFPVYEAIIRRAERIKADLIVADQHLGKHRAAGLLHLTDWELLRLSPIPVLLVKTSGTYRHPAVLAAVDPAHTYSKPARLDRRILQASATLARGLRGSQHVLHAYAPFPFAVDPELMMDPKTVEDLQAKAESAAHKLLDRELRTTRIPKAQRHLVGRSAPDAIAQTAGEIDSSIVVMGAVSRSGLSRLFIGNTAERTLDLLKCDVLVVKPAHFGNKIPRGKRGARVVAYSTTVLPL
jgi:universal stress protein E